MAAAASALLVFPLAFLRSFAYSGIAVVLLAAAAALVVLPAVLAILGTRINSLTIWKRSIRPPANGFWSRAARGVMRRPVLVIVSSLVVLSVLAAHTAWHWMTERYAILSRFPLRWPVIDAALLAAAMQWMMIFVIFGGAVWFVSGALRSRNQREHEA